MSNSPLSTSALAKALGKTTKQMFAELESLGWIERQTDSWQLTTKGEFEGGNYRESQKFGRYIIWPSSVTEHNALSNPDTHLFSCTKLAKKLSLTRKMLDQIFSELGWVVPSRKGWEITSQGLSVGGCQRENADTAVPFVMWPSSLIDHPVLIKQVQERLQTEHLTCIDGHSVSSEQELKIDNWLYYSGLLHAYRRRMPFEEEYYADFYLPQYHLYIEYWGAGNEAAQVGVKMRKRERLTEAGYHVIELQDQDIENLDEVLPRKLLKFGIET